MMKKKIEWAIIQANGNLLYHTATRSAARWGKKDYEQGVFEDWAADIAFPLHIVRREYALVDEKKVR